MKPQITAAPIDFITSYTQAIGCDVETAQQHFSELVKFLTVCNESKEPCSLSNNLDVVWHSFILCTEAYSAFCHKHFDRLIHHKPNLDQEASLYAYTRAIAGRKYGQLDYYFWPPADESTADCANCSDS